MNIILLNLSLYNEKQAQNINLVLFSMSFLKGSYLSNVFCFIFNKAAL